MDAEMRLENLFWCHAQCLEWYKTFGDVVVFDTTYKVNAYDMPCAFFVGIDNHGKTILFGSALLRNETTNTFKWLMKTFKSVMKTAPKTIVTDQDPWMSEAIASEMPTTKHSFCIWHITSKFSSWFTALLKKEYQNWCAEFYTLYRMSIVEEFEHNWSLVVAKYNLQNNRHVQGMYNIRQFWAPCYLRDYFFGGMTTTGRSESINAFIKRFVSSHTNLSDFVKQVELAVDELRQGQLQNTMTATLKPTSKMTKSPLEEQVFQVFTPFAFRKFQEEFKRANMYLLARVEGNDFTVRYFEGVHQKNHKVFWDGNDATCSCKNFEFWGILCRHILRVFIHKDCFRIPNAYLPERWYSDTAQRANKNSEDVVVDNNLIDLESDVEDNALEGNILCPPKSTTKGRPRKRRIKGGKELVKKSKTCSGCKIAGHTRPTCPGKENGNLVDKSSSHKPSKRNKSLTSELGLNPIFNVKY